MSGKRRHDVGKSSASSGLGCYVRALVALLFLIAVPLIAVAEHARSGNVKISGMIMSAVGLAAVYAVIWLLDYLRTPFAHPDDALREYKRVLAGILPAEVLTAEGFLRGRDGHSEPIALRTFLGTVTHRFRGLPRFGNSARSSAYYIGNFHLKAIRHRLLLSRDRLPGDEFEQLRTALDDALRADGADHDVIDISRCRTRGTLAHEAFHDIQGFLYDNDPVTFELLQQAVAAREQAITAWYKTQGGKWRSGYRLEQMFPSTLKDVRDLWKKSDLLSRWVQGKSISSEAARKHVAEEACKDFGRIEAVPTLLGVAVDGDEHAKAILREIFSEAGLKTDLL